MIGCRNHAGRRWIVRLVGPGRQVRCAPCDSPFGSLFVNGSAGGTARATVRDSVFAGSSAYQAGTVRAVASVRGGDDAGEDAVLTSYGSTFYATGPAWHAAVLATRGPTLPGNVGMQLINTVVRFQEANGTTTADLIASTQSPGGSVTVDAASSAYTSALVSGLSTAPAPGSGTNITGDPLFVATPAATLSGADLSLQAGSPLVDRGDPAHVLAGELDFAGAARSLDGKGDCLASPDIGAYERALVACPAPAPAPPPLVPPPAADAVKPVLRSLRVNKGKATFTLSEVAKVTLVVERSGAGRRLGRRCVAARRTGRRCVRWVRVRKLSLPAGRTGTNAIKLGKLVRARYRVRTSAVDAAGNASAPIALSFSVLR